MISVNTINLPLHLVYLANSASIFGGGWIRSESRADLTVARSDLTRVPIELGATYTTPFFVRVRQDANVLCT